MSRSDGSDVTSDLDWVEVGWTDADGDRGHVIVGASLRDLMAAPGTIARITVQPKGSDLSYPVDVPRDIAELLYSALDRGLKRNG